jgi:hypothetical protein
MSYRSTGWQRKQCACMCASARGLGCFTNFLSTGGIFDDLGLTDKVRG